METGIILEKLEAIRVRYEDIGAQIAAPDAMSDMKRYVKLSKEYRDLEPLIEVFDEYRNVLSNLREARDILQTEKDAELREMAQEEADALSQRVEPLEAQIKILLDVLTREGGKINDVLNILLVDDNEAAYHGGIPHAWLKSEKIEVLQISLAGKKSNYQAAPRQIVETLASLT